MNRFPLLTKLAALALVFLLLNGALAMIRGLVHERRGHGEQAARSVEQSLAGRQTLLGPLLQRRCTETWSEWEGEAQGQGATRQRVVRERTIVLAAAPHRLEVGSTLATDVRYRGIHKVNGYAGRLVFDARWNDLTALQPQAAHPGGRVRCDPVRAWLAADDVRGLRSAQAQVDGVNAAVVPGTPREPVARGLQLVLDAARSDDAARPLAVQLTIELIGTTRLALVPAAGETRWTLQADWPHPSFGGRFLPASRTVTPEGFAATWAVSTLSSTAAADAVGDGVVCPARDDALDDGAAAPRPASTAGGANAGSRPCLDTMSVTFIDPVNPYVLTDRATKYAVLFIVLTFGCVGVSEVMRGRPVHPIQYTLVGLALAIFFLLLLSLSEHIAFGRAYAAASAACVALLAFYGRFMLGGWRGALAMGAGVALLYGVLWTLLQMEQTALVIGSMLLFAVLAGVMVLTRRVDWYAVFGAGRRT